MPLPIELVLDIINCYTPAPDVLLNASHPTTKTLLSFTLVCHETRRVANRLLRQHCVYLDSQKRLQSYLQVIPKRPELRKVTSLYLAPFDEDIDDLPLCSSVRDLLCHASETLTKLIINIPLRTCYPDDGPHYAVRKALREGFESLVNLEEFVSVQDELFIDLWHMEHAVVWTRWPKLKRLALYNPDMDEEFWRHVAQHPSLETLALMNVDSIEQVNCKEAYFRHTDRPLTVFFCLSWYWYGGRSREFRNVNWKRYDPQGKMTIIERHIPERDEEDDPGPNRRYVRAAAEDGSLWRIGDESAITHLSQMARVVRGD